MPRRFLALAFALAVGCRSQHSDSQPASAIAASEHRAITLPEIFELSSKLRAPSGLHQGWLADGSHYLATDEHKHLVSVDVESGATQPWFDPTALKRALVAAGAAESDAEKWSAQTTFEYDDAKDVLLLDQANDLWVWKLGSERAVRLTNTPEEELGATFSPDGKQVAFVRGNNVFVADVNGGERQLTTDGSVDHLVGRLDWVYQEEVYGRGNFQGFWWSPDSKSIAVLVLEEKPVHEMTIPDDRPTPYPDNMFWRYPKSGTPNPSASLMWLDVASAQRHNIDLAGYAEDDRLIVRVGWTPDSSSIVFQVQNRIQTWLDLLTSDRSTGVTKRILRDATPVWIEPVDPIVWLDGGKRFIWTSERDGYKHLYLYRANGELETRLTHGEWEVDALLGCDEANGWIYIVADTADVKGDLLYRLKLDGSQMERYGEVGGSHAISMSPNFRYYLDTWSTIASPGAIQLRGTDRRELRTLWKADDAKLAAMHFQAPKFVKVKTRDGFEMEAEMIEPAHFDSKQKYPVVSYTYSGPHAPSVRDAWGGFNALFHQMLAQEGYLIWICDNRSASGKGLASEKDIYKNLGAEELRDLEDGVDWLVAQGHADPARVALWGVSYGGYMTAYALTHSKRFKLGMSGAPVTDWHLYDSIYTERYMDVPQVNAAGYESSSVVKAAANLNGKLLLVHGTIDENVHMQNSLQFAEALQKANKPFEMMLYPGNHHGVTEPSQRKHFYGMMADFFRANL